MYKHTSISEFIYNCYPPKPETKKNASPKLERHLNTTETILFRKQ